MAFYDSCFQLLTWYKLNYVYKKESNFCFIKRERTDACFMIMTTGYDSVSHCNLKHGCLGGFCNLPSLSLLAGFSSLPLDKAVHNRHINCFNKVTVKV